MPWFKVDDQLTRSKKVLSIPRRYRMQAMGLWVMAGSWSAGELTDGFIPEHMLAELGGTKAIAAKLVDARLWKNVSRGFLIESWSDYQPVANDVKANRQRDAERKRRAREKWSQNTSKRRDQHEEENVRADATRTPSGVPPESMGSPDGIRSTRPDPTRTLKETPYSPPPGDDDDGGAVTGELIPIDTAPPASAAPKYPAAFEAWWSEYPRKTGKGDALKAWRKAVKDIGGADALMEATRARLPSIRDRETRFQPNPATWLNQARYDDEITDQPEARPRNGFLHRHMQRMNERETHDDQQKSRSISR